MSTVAIVRKNGLVALAADTLWKDGSTMQRASRLVHASKILQVGPSLVGFTGSSAWGDVLRRYFSKLDPLPPLDSSAAIFEAVLALHPVLKREYGMNPEDGDDDQFQSSRFSLLVASPGGAFAVYGDRSVAEFSTFWAFGSGFRYALGAMHAAYPVLDRAEDIARIGVEAAAEFDEDTGLPAEVRTVALQPAPQENA
ncbi:MAG: hypothetical protein K2W96_04395 [Gemmataceae bacterium]|nr:hypothetical protein [Gemmataceae bacterium]